LALLSKEPVPLSLAAYDSAPSTIYDGTDSTTVAPVVIDREETVGEARARLEKMALRPKMVENCRFFFDFNCVDNNGFRHFDLSSPGTPNLANTNLGANDQISSYICFG